ncbi:hypothetical protein ACIBFB_01725 [Nocardiopsis sp. NPDC050513]|uniref:hypothetical protein n=1 Tax=Nocardiopsis sp. NPDC050513 TaxID=3364338 RepID=UPI003792744F
MGESEDERRLARALEEAARQPTREAREAARERAVRNHARRGVVQIGAFMGLFGIPFVLVAMEGAGLVPQALTVQPMAAVGGIAAVLGGVFAWIYGARQFFRVSDRIIDRRRNRRGPSGSTAPRTAPPAPGPRRSADSAETVAKAGPAHAETAANSGLEALRSAPDTPRAGVPGNAPGRDEASTPVHPRARRVDLTKRPARRGA